jgi:hypothetical protein
MTSLALHRSVWTLRLSSVQRSKAPPTTHHSQSTHKPTIVTMQLSTIATTLFAAVAIAGPIALPAKEVAADNVKVPSFTERSTTIPSQMTDEALERYP